MMPLRIWIFGRKIIANNTRIAQHQRFLKTFYASQQSDLNEEDTNEEERKSKKNERNNDRSKSNLPKIISPFEEAKIKTKETYMDMVTIFEGRDVRRRNHVEFIYAALKNMEVYNVHKDIDVYKALINVMPKGKFIPTNIIQAEFMHYPKQQQCIIDLLEQMEDNGVIPDYEMEAMLLNIFGRRGHPLRKYWRMMYWMPKFKNLSPWLLPNPVPNDAFDLAKLAIERMCTVDLLSEVTVFETKDVKESIDDTWIVSGMSPEQSELLRKHDETKSLFIEGPFIIWIREKTVNYFILRGDSVYEKLAEVSEQNENVISRDETDDVSNIRIPFLSRPPVNERRLAQKRSIHEQDDGTIFAICATGSSSQDSLLSWIRLLQKNGNPRLSEIPILFRFRSSVGVKLVPINIKDER